MKRSGLPHWLMVLMVLAAMIFLGPPALGLLAGLLGVAIGLTAITLKFGIIALGVYAVVLLVRAVFGRSTPARLPSPTPTPIDYEADLSRDDEEKRALDAELARMMAAQKSV
jgi:membrane protein implicated in regulation of membrane protease activity